MLAILLIFQLFFICSSTGPPRIFYYSFSVLKQLARVQQRVADRKIRIEISDSAIEFLGNLGYDPNYGARPVKRILQQYVENGLAKGILRGDLKDEDEILIDTEVTVPSNGQLPVQKLVFRKLNPKPADKPSSEERKFLPTI
jgi:ATP-dependent Clp protease ATP-binding subunit ClpB